MMAIALCISTMAYAQGGRVTVTGTVTDASNLPIPGVTVTVDGTDQGTTTDVDGKYSIEVASSDILTFSFIGYAPQSVAVGARTTIDVQLAEDTQALDEVVVVGYGTQAKKDITGSVAVVSRDAIAEQPVSSFAEALQGRAAGVTITNAGGPAGDSQIRIRGVGSVNGSDPLIIVDGVQGVNISSVNPNDIETMQVLKDAAATAIYGARGANGVVLVTTKQAKAGKYTVTYDGFYGIQNVQRMPEMLDAKQYMDAQSMLTVNAGGAPIDWANILDPKLYASIMDGSFKGTNWLDAIRNQNAPYQNHAVNVVGGSDRTKMSMGISNTSQEGIFGYPVQSKYNRTTVRINSDHVILRKGNLDVISLGQNMTYTYSTKSGIGIGNHYWNDIFNMLQLFSQFFGQYFSDRFHKYLLFLKFSYICTCFFQKVF